MSDKGDIIASAEHWERLAEEAARMAAWDRERGIDLSVPGCSAGDYKARTYRDTAKSLRLEAATGKPHCSCHFSPNCPSQQRRC
jgi:hypothetical protein